MASFSIAASIILGLFKTTLAEVRRESGGAQSNAGCRFFSAHLRYLLSLCECGFSFGTQSKLKLPERPVVIHLTQFSGLGDWGRFGAKIAHGQRAFEVGFHKVWIMMN